MVIMQILTVICMVAIAGAGRRIDVECPDPGGGVVFIIILSLT
jgi:hypothetical protein